MNLSVLCSEDVARLSSSTASNDFLGVDLLLPVQQMCEVWPQTSVPSSFFEPVVSDIPVLILSGELDPVTPPKNGERLLSGLSNGEHLVAPGVAHNVLSSFCVAKVVEVFLEDLSTSSAEKSCLSDLKRPSFFVDFSGPLP